MSTSIICPQCHHDFDTNELYNTGWAFNNDEGTDHIDCDCGERIVVKHYFVKHFEILDEFESEEYLSNLTKRETP